MRAKILVADDDETTRFILRKFLELDGHSVLTAGDGAQAWETVRAESPDLVLCDWMMPGLDGVELCRRIKSDGQLAPTYVVIVSAKEDRPEKIMALEAGADEFLTKPVDMAELKTRVKVGLRIVDYQKRLQAMALTDELTRVANRRAFDAAIKRESDRASRFGTPLALLILDVDRFKEINDQYGHERGDAVLCRVAERLVDLLGCGDAVFRIGGDEFAVLLPEPEDQVRAAVARLETAFPKRAGPGLNESDAPSISIGLAQCEPGDTPGDLFRRADAEMYEHKRPSSDGDRRERREPVAAEKRAQESFFASSRTAQDSECG